MGFNTKRVKIWTIWDTPETSNIGQNDGKNTFSLQDQWRHWFCGIVKSTHPSGIQKPPVSVQTKKLSLEESSVRISDVSITGTSSGVKKIKKTSYKLPTLDDWGPIGGPPKSLEKAKQAETTPSGLSPPDLFHYFRCQHPASTSRRSSRCK